MKRNSVIVGQLVAVNDLDDGQVYQVKQFTDKFVVELEYQNMGRTCNGGYMDVSILKLPTRKQLAYYNTTK